MNAGQAPAQSIAPEKARVVFSNGGRILSVDAGGGDRKVLFGRSRNPVQGPFGAVEPAVSPGGGQLAFAWRRETGTGNVSDIWLARGDGSRPRRILKSNRKMRFGDPVFSPRGDLVVAYFKASGRRAEAGLAKVDDDGSIVRKLLVDRQTRRRFQDWTTIRDPRFSPDGKKILYGTTEGGYADAFSSRLRILDLASGRIRLLAREALDGDWSPGGNQIVYTALTWDEDFEVCGVDEAICLDGGRLKIIGVDGKGGRKLVSTGGDQRSPEWSRDGRIVFQSAGNMPNQGEAYENFSVRPNGGCLTMLTNGAPASSDPAWVENNETSTAPERCGSRPALTLEMRKPTPKGDLKNMFWAGARADSRLYTGIDYDGRVPYLEYGDCSRQNSAECGSMFYIAQAPTCSLEGDLASLVGGKPVRRQRGVPVFHFVGEEVGPVSYLVSGGFALYVFGGSRGGVKEINALRFLSQTSATGDLPAPKFPVSDIRRMEKVKRTFAATGSVAVTANRLGVSRALIRRNLRLSRAIRRYGDFETIECGSGA
jgi:Tol biopolymer transport system component